MTHATTTEPAHPTTGGGADGDELDRILAAFLDLDGLREQLHRDTVSEYLLLELLERGYVGDALAILRHPSVTTAVVAKALRYEVPSVRGRAATHPLAPVEGLVGRIRDRSYHVRLAVVANPTTPREVRDRMVFDNYREVRRAAVRGDISPAMIETLSKPEHKDLWDVLAGRPDLLHHQAARLARRGSGLDKVILARTTPYADLLYLLAGSSDRYVAKATASNSAATVDVLHRLCDRPDPEIRRLVVVRPDLPEPIVERLATDPDTFVRERLALTCTDPFVLARLANDPERDARIASARNPHTPAVVLAELIVDGSELVQLAVVGRTDLPPAVIREACVSRYPRVRRLARRAGMFVPRPPRSADDVEPEVFRWAEATTDTRRIVELLERAEIHPLVALALLERGHDASVARAAAVADDWRVRRAAVEMPNCPFDVQHSLVSDERPEVRVAAVRRVPLNPELAARIAADPRAAVRRALLQRGGVPESVRQALSRDPVRIVREAAARTP